MTGVFANGPVTVRVPATSANLGPGFDCFGLALSRHDTVTASTMPDGLQLCFSGEGADSLPRDERHLIVRSMRSTFEVLGAQPPGLRIECANVIPHGRGLGSSAAAIVSGILLARSLTVGGSERLDENQVLQLATELEGHPDNVAACLLGGLTLAWTVAADGSVSGVGRAIRLEPVGIQPVIFVPTVESSTKAARAALPNQVPHADAAFNAARAALLTAALTGRPELLLESTEDRLHQQYRAAGMPQSTELVAALRGAGIAAVISGAGSSVLALLPSGQAVETALGFGPAGWDCAAVAVADGAAVTS